MKRNWLLIVGLVLVLGIVGLTGCASEEPPVSHGGLEDITWTLESYGEQGDLQAVLEGTEITAIFDSAEGRVRGSAGCNSYSGDYQVSNDKLSMPLIAATEMYCLEPEGVNEQEQQYLRVLTAAESYKIEDGKLQITSGNQVLIFRGSEE